MSRLPRLNAHEMVRALRGAGFVRDRQMGSHLTMLHPAHRTRVVVPMHPGDLSLGLIHDILKQVGLSNEQLERLLR
jgi:predicted RNA binding protein YcfA (HicA-like mRNA interferase family)